ncbi:MAG: hypothetical protein V1660_00455 [archaeon]
MGEGYILPRDEYIILYRTIKECLKISEDKFCTFGIGFPNSIKSHAIILKKRRITDVNFTLRCYRSVYLENKKKRYTHMKIEMSRKNYSWNGEIDKVIDLIDRYRHDNMIILGIGPGRLEKKIEDVAEKFTDGVSMYIDKKRL